MNLYVSYYSFDEVTELNLTPLIPTGRTVNIGTDATVHIIRVGNYLYSVRDPGPGSPIVDKIDPITMTVVDSLVLTFTDWLGTIGPNQNLASDDTYLYVSADRPFLDNGRIIRIDLNTFTEVDFLVDALRVPILQMDANNNLYIGHWLSNVIDRIPAGTFAVDTSLNMSVLTYTQAMCCKGNYLYVVNGRNRAPDGHDHLCRIDLTTFTEDTNLNTDATERWGWSLAADDTYLYCGLATAAAPTKIVRFALNPFARVDVLTIAGHMDTWTLLIDGDYLIAILEESPSTVHKIKRSTFSLESSLTPDPALGDAWSGALALILSPRTTKPIIDIVTLEAIRNVEMSAMGRFYVDESGNAKYESRYARNP